MHALEEEDFQSLLAQLKKTVPHVLPDIASDWLTESAQVIAADIEKGLIGAGGDDYKTLMESLKWHIRRKKSFGASEMSALYTEYKGDWYPFGTAADVVKQKLCLSAVEPSTGDTSRGNYLEPMAREMYIRKMRSQGVYLEPDSYAKEQLSKLRFGGGIPGMEWMDCSPDDIFLDQDGRRYLIDYKTPADESTVSSMLSRVPEYYQAQLGQEVIIFEYLGIQIDEVYLVPFSVKNMDVYPVSCVIDDQLKEDVVNAGNFYWKCVEKLELPRRPPSREYQFVDTLPPVLQQGVLEYAYHNKAKIAHGKEEERLKESLSELMIKHNIDIENRDVKVIMPLVDSRWQTRTTINQTAVLGKLKEFGVDTDDKAFWNESESRVMSLTRSSANRYHEVAVQIEDFVISNIAEGRSHVVEDFLEKFKARDSVVVEPKKAAKKAKAAAVAVDEGPGF